MNKHNIQTGTNNEVLRAHAEPVKAFNSELKKIEKDMMKIMEEEKGVGIAAPQVNESLRMVICKFEKQKPKTLCNPEITWHSNETELGLEGCLSLPGVWGKVRRSKEVIVKYQDIKGKSQQIKLEGFSARIIQHEIDHLEGVLFSDRVEGTFEVDDHADLEKLELDILY